jgi:hypothetical protein
MELGRDELANLGFPVMVENWEKRKSGRVKRAWLREFNESERRYLSAMYQLFYRWYLVTGTPGHFTFREMAHFELVRRAINFFATI